MLTDPNDLATKVLLANAAKTLLEPEVDVAARNLHRALRSATDTGNASMALLLLTGAFAITSVRPGREAVVLESLSDALRLMFQQRFPSLRDAATTTSAPATATLH